MRHSILSSFRIVQLAFITHLQISPIKIKGIFNKNTECSLLEDVSPIVINNFRSQCRVIASVAGVCLLHICWFYEAQKIFASIYSCYYQVDDRAQLRLSVGQFESDLSSALSFENLICHGNLKEDTDYVMLHDSVDILIAQLLQKLKNLRKVEVIL